MPVCLALAKRREMMKSKLNFDLLPSNNFFETRSFWKILDKELENALSRHPETLDRARGAVMFAEAANGHNDTWIDGAYLRAALGEFRSMEEAFGRDMAELGTTKTFKLVDSENPFLHLIKILRDLNFHVKRMDTAKESREASWREQTFEHTVVLVADLSLEDFIATSNTKYYEMQDLERMFDWFNSAQSNWGAGYVVRVAVETYIKELSEFYMANGYN